MDAPVPLPSAETAAAAAAAAGEAATTTATTETATRATTRGERRRARREEEFEAKREWRRQKRAETRKRKRDARAAEVQAARAADLLAPEFPHEPPRPKLSERVELRKASQARAAAGAPTVVLDMSFAHLMGDNECRSMAKQMSAAYSINRVAPWPVRLEVCGLDANSAMASAARTLAGGNFQGWTSNGLVVTEEPFHVRHAAALQAGKVVYLTADSPHELGDVLDPTSVLVVGGFVDRNRHKGVTAARAAELGVRTAKFPLDAYFAESKFCRVLTTNQCVEILLELLASRSWQQTLTRCVPMRKVKIGLKYQEVAKKQRAEAEARGPAHDHDRDPDRDPDPEDDNGKEEEEEEEDGDESAPGEPTKRKRGLVVGADTPAGFALVESLIRTALEPWELLLTASSAESASDVLRRVRLMPTRTPPVAVDVAVFVGEVGDDADMARLVDVCLSRFPVEQGLPLLALMNPVSSAPLAAGDVGNAVAEWFRRLVIPFRDVKRQVMYGGARSAAVVVASGADLPPHAPFQEWWAAVSRDLPASRRVDSTEEAARVGEELARRP